MYQPRMGRNHITDDNVKGSTAESDTRIWRRFHWEKTTNYGILGDCGGCGGKITHFNFRFIPVRWLWRQKPKAHNCHLIDRTCTQPILREHSTIHFTHTAIRFIHNISALPYPGLPNSFPQIFCTYIVPLVRQKLTDVSEVPIAYIIR